MTYFDVLDLTIQECTTTIDGSSDVIEKKTSLLLTHLLKSFHMHIVRKLSLIRKLYVILIACVDPLACWHNHDNQFPNVDFLAKMDPQNSTVVN